MEKKNNQIDLNPPIFMKQKFTGIVVSINALG